MAWSSKFIANIWKFIPMSLPTGSGPLIPRMDPTKSSSFRRTPLCSNFFQYMYRQPQPNLQDVEFPVFAGLAEAAEKYVMYAALPAIMIKMEDCAAKYPLEVLNYAARHDHKALANHAARMSMALPVAQAVAILSPDTLAKWAMFYDQWHARARNLLASCIENQPRNVVVAIAEINRCVRDPKLCYTTRARLTYSHTNLFAFLDSEFMT
ncbi:hypothetical protein DFH07DRAFT_176011 [Mycena maculata]|uniref:Uncharacterized protein n=1 Tax=Mycena maculata TaxID=230809 RepID=A0AAD7HWX9_9AGAR|nr:hypothetical protein DFH07DRAFT_176011 [Mycena maculata]